MDLHDDGETPIVCVSEYKAAFEEYIPKSIPNLRTIRGIKCERGVLTKVSQLMTVNPET